MQLGSFLPFCNSSAPMSGVAAASESRLPFNNLPAAAISRKRLRDGPFPGDEVVSSHIQHQFLDLDRLILHHAEKVRVELMELWKQSLRRTLAAAEEGLSKRLKAKDEEIVRISELNWALEERIKSLCVENEMWMDLARSNEATAQGLRTSLEHALAVAARAKAEEEEEEAAVAAMAVVDDAESCCSCGDNAEAENKNSGAAEVKRSGRRRVCRFCREEEPSVLLLPCQHLCVCAACGPAAVACPICHCNKNSSVLVNMS